MIAEKIRHIGKIVKLHGFEGEALIVFDEVYAKKITKTEWVFLLIDGLPVPFFISNLNLRSDSSAIIRLSDIGSSEEMAYFVNCEVAIIDTSQKSKTTKVSQSDISGYKVIDENRGEIGKAVAVINYNENYVLQVLRGDQEILVPVAEEIVIAIDDKKKIISVCLPEGLLELNF